MLLTSNEGWGLSLTESMMAETMIAANVTGGMQDQMRFVNNKGKWIDFDADFPSNHRGTYKKHGKWALPIWPTNMSMMGSPLTPYIFDDRCRFDDAAQRIKEWYDMTADERRDCGMKGHEFVKREDVMMTSDMMCQNFINDAIRLGAKGALVDHIPADISSNTPLLLVPSVQEALENLGKYRRERSQAKVVAITGSVGKTSSKNMLKTILELQGKTVSYTHLRAHET